MRALATAIVLLALLPAAAAAKTGISIDSTPDGLSAGEPWDVTFQYIRNDAQVTPRGVTPSVSIVSEDSSIRKSFPAHLTHQGLWSARVYFPRPGVWDYSIRGFGRQAGNQSWDAVTITAPAKPAVTASSTGGGSLFPFGWAGGGAVIVLLAAGLLAVKFRS